MVKYEAGFIGAGNMGGALALAAIKKVGGGKVAVSCSSEESTTAKAAKLGCAAAHAEDVIADSRYVFLGVKPQMLRSVVQSLEKPLHEAETVFVSMIAGVSLDTLAQLLGADRKIIRIMPNTACAVGQGVLLVCANANVTAQELAGFEEMMEHSGVVDRIDEKLIDAASAVSGCGPAYAYMFIEALADGGVKCGLPRAKAIRYAALMLLGSAEMVLQSGKHPELLKDEVCSPGGSTIAGVAALEEHSFRSACIDAVDAAYEKTKKLG